jgi:hypothetical protein
MKTNYQKQAKDFLTDTKTMMTILKAIPQKHPIWSMEENKHGINYSVMMKNANGTYIFDFWNSIKAKAENKKPSYYDVLACINPLSENNFKDFCDNFGYNTDSILADKTYQACLEQDRELKKLFTSEQLEKLSEIN